MSARTRALHLHNNLFFSLYRYLASGDSFVSLAFNYRLGKTTVGRSVHIVCAAIEKKMMELFLPKPTVNTWKEVAQGFWEKWNFPNCLGALDGKHVVIQYSNYKKTSSIVLFALVDAEYRFRCIQVGDFSTTSDDGVYASSELGKGMEKNMLHVPPNACLSGAAHLGEVPYVMVGDAAFPLKTYLMRPYPGKNLSHDKRIFNYRLSRARMVVENALGILASRWRVFYSRINLHPKHVDTLVVAACILHNFLLDPNENVQLLDEAEELGRCMSVVGNMGGNRASREALGVRECFTTFFTSPEGSVSWQNKMV